jgi:8-oxo-dGTP pyrophosphatase MutT (NUDIX family)
LAHGQQPVTELSHIRASRRAGRESHVIRQIAALPYRIRGGAVDTTVSILLVTSRETKRWVIPKGNRIAGLKPHEAAAQEAEEEAGVRGAVCPTALGSFRYRKIRKTGPSLMLDVDVYSLQVTHELDSWKEADERQRRWFSPGEAANAVEEPDLADLIRSFGASRPKC